MLDRYITSTKRLILFSDSTDAPWKECLTKQFEQVWQSGDKPWRHFHHPQHFMDVQCFANPNASILDAVAVRAAMHHDLVYAQVDQLHSPDKSAIAPQWHERLSPYLSVENQPDGSVNFRLKQTHSLSEDPLFRAAMKLFGIADERRKSGDMVIPAHKGGNEFASALLALAMGKELRIHPNYILAEMAMIEATIPFRPLGYFEQTGIARLEAANTHLSQNEQIPPETLDAIMRRAVYLANEDVNGFMQPFNVFLRNTQELWQENHLPEQLDDPVARLNILSGRVRFLSGLVAEDRSADSPSIFHHYPKAPPGNEQRYGSEGDHEPHRNEIQDFEKHARINADCTILYEQAHRVALMAMAASYHHRHQHASPPNTIHSIDWNIPAEQVKNAVAIHDSDNRISSAIIEATTNSKLSGDQATGYLLALLGAEEVIELAGHIAPEDVRTPDKLKAFHQRLLTRIHTVREQAIAHVTPKQTTSVQAVSDNGRSADKADKIGSAFDALIERINGPQRRVDAASVHAVAVAAVGPVIGKNTMELE